MLRQTKQTDNVPIEGQRQRRWLRLVGIVVVAFALGLLMHTALSLATPIRAQAAALTQSSPNDGEFTYTFGTLISRPDHDGSWVISNTEEITFVADSETEIVGELAAGACVVVKTQSENSDHALRIGLADAAEHCNKGDNGSDGGNQGDVTTTVGVLQQRQQKAGTWIVDGKSFTVTMDTIIEEQHGGLPVGACVEVTALVSDPTTAIKIASLEKSECGDDNGGDHEGNGGDEHGGDDHHGDLGRTIDFGIVKSMPDGKEGQWSIGDHVYTATVDTELEEEHGVLELDVCAKVTVLKSNRTVALQIKSMPLYLCTRGQDNLAKGTLFGVVQELPDDLHNGIWLVGGISFTISSKTELVDNDMEFTKGVTVKVDFVTDISDTNFAQRIEIKFGLGNPCVDDSHDFNVTGESHEGDDHEHDFGHCPGLQGKALGAIEKRPDGTLLGQWTIGGVPYLTNAFTKFSKGDFKVGDQVKVEYIVLNSQLRFAVRIRGVEGNPGNSNESMIVGNITAKPDGFIGDWEIDNAPFVAVSDTVFVEHGSLFAVGAFVVVNYHITNDQRIIDKIVTYIPPGAGDEDKSGDIESITPAVSVASVDATPSSNEIWTIGGVPYIVGDATMVVDNGSNLQPGVTVSVNSYVDNGQRFATLIRQQGDSLFLPMTSNK